MSIPDAVTNLEQIKGHVAEAVNENRAALALAIHAVQRDTEVCEGLQAIQAALLEWSKASDEAMEWVYNQQTGSAK